ncbi:hypothetical protein PNK_0052 [Candidatus Protochlamydia naegleriophila]|uniref:Uncharacterized protein n=1 Tax=Candidatus Protochlamydia naegleriophila TaxID=389348 RepID=A0A0U5K0Q8_9BACT|nr:hypothetical protein [Candidatus Protochlamydia naegleriophila]CUI15691.1 hypothetical protein PNK_0052 [Candidatus Protochlamydia naegleriophila]
MIAAIPYFNGALTLIDNTFNVLGYLPKCSLPHFHDSVTTWRWRYGAAQTVMGIALFTLSVSAECLSRQTQHAKYLTIYQQAMSLGLLYANHGVFNVARAMIEKQGGSRLTFAYDFYGRKWLPALAPAFDLQSQLFERIKQILDRLYFVTLFPPQISFKLN